MKFKTLALSAAAILLLAGCNNGGGSETSSTKASGFNPPTTSEAPAPITIEGNDFLVPPPYKDAGTVYHFDYEGKKLTTKQYGTYGSYALDNGYVTEYGYEIAEFEVIATRKVYKKQGYKATSEYESDMIVFFYEEKEDGSQGDLFRMKCDKTTSNYDEVKGLAAKVYQVKDTCWEDFKGIAGKKFRCADQFTYSSNTYYLEFRMTADYKITVFQSKDLENWQSPYQGSGVQIPLRIMEIEYLGTADDEHTSSFGWDSRFTLYSYNKETNSFKVNKEAGHTNTGFIKLSFTMREFTLVE